MRTQRNAYRGIHVQTGMVERALEDASDFPRELEADTDEGKRVLAIVRGAKIEDATDHEIAEADALSEACGLMDALEDEISCTLDRDWAERAGIALEEEFYAWDGAWEEIAEMAVRARAAADGR